MIFVPNLCPRCKKVVSWVPGPCEVAVDEISRIDKSARQGHVVKCPRCRNVLVDVIVISPNMAV